MSEVTFLRQVSNLSLFFSIVNFVMAYMYGPKTSYLIFILVLLVIYINEEKKLKNIIWPKFLLVLLFVPFIWANNFNDIVYYAVIDLYAVYASLKPARFITYINCTEEFKRGAFITVIILILAMAFSNISIIEDAVIPYSIVYFVSSVVFLRTLRYTEYNSNDKRINKINVKYSAIITITAFLAGIKPIRETAVMIFGLSYNIISELLLKVFSWVIIGVAYIVQFVIYLLKLIYENKLTGDEEEVVEKGSIGESDFLRDDFADNIINFFNKNHIFSIILKLMIFSIILYVIIRLLRRKNKSERFLEDYKETKEQLNINGSGEEKLGKRISDLLKPKSPSEYIRFYYRKYLLMSIKKNVDITKKDTTLEIKQKTEKIFREGPLDKMRDTYIRVRYGEYAADKNASKEFRKCYDEIERSK